MNKIKILIVEDNMITAMDIKQAIFQLNFKVTAIVTSVNDVFISIKENEPNIILMDISLNDKIDGIDVVKKIYENKYIPVIYLTGSDDDETIQRAVQTNPVGYLLKPFNRGELKSTILLGVYKYKNLQDYVGNEHHKHLGFNYYYDFNEQKLYYHDKFIKLGINEIKLLELLIQSKGKDVSFRMIEYEIWGDVVITKNAIRILAYRLKIKLDGKFIESVPYYGYKIISIL